MMPDSTFAGMSPGLPSERAAEPDPQRLLGRVLRITLPAFLALALTIFGVNRIDRAGDLEVGRQASWGVVQLQASTLENELASLSSTLVHLSEGAVVDFLTGSAAAEVTAQSLDRFRQLHPRLLGFTVFDLAGALRLAVGAAGDGEADRAAFEEARGFLSGQVYISPLTLETTSASDGRPGAILRFAAAIGDAQGERHGVLVMTYFARSLVARLSQAAIYASGSIFLVDERGTYLVASKDGKSWGIAPSRSFAEDHPDAWPRLVAKSFDRGFGTAAGMYTFRSVAPASPTDLPGKNDLRTKVVSFLPQATLFHDSRRTLRWMVAGGAVALLATTVAAWRLGQLSLQKEERDRRLAASERRLRLLSNKLLDAQEAERRGIARELHDDVGQLATAITIDLKRAERAPSPQEKDALVARALGGTSRLLESMHRIAGRIRTGVLDDLGLSRALAAYVSEFGERAGLATELELEFDEADVPQNVAVNAYRIVQEALTNVLKHAQAKTVSVSVSMSDDTLLLKIDDDGRGFDAGAVQDERFGLLGMRERVELLDGTFALRSGSGQGTHIEARLPVRPAGDAP
jgi:signal transduction histidine kinase